MILLKNVAIVAIILKICPHSIKSTLALQKPQLCPCLQIKCLILLYIWTSSRKSFVFKFAGSTKTYVGKDTKTQNLISNVLHTLLIRSLLAFSPLCIKYNKVRMHMVRLTLPSPLIFSFQSFLSHSPFFWEAITTQCSFLVLFSLLQI